MLLRNLEINAHMNYCCSNVVTADMTQELILAGADIVKVGIGPAQFAQQESKLVLAILN